MKTAKEWLKWHEDNPAVSDEELNRMIQSDAVAPFAVLLTKTADRMVNICAERARGHACAECVELRKQANALISSSNASDEVLRGRQVPRIGSEP